MLQAYRRYADFTGRANRSEYWLFTLFVFLVAMGIAILNAVAAIAMGRQAASLVFGALYALFLIGSFVPSLAVQFRRLHDIDRSAWWVLIGFLPLIGGLVLLVFDLLPGTPAPNRFGPPPGEAAPAEVFA
jgi:uncharacterized membrane protein YhaH (DUF805 family)